MKKQASPPPNPREYLAGLDGWRRKCVLDLRKEVLASASVDEVVKWGHLVYSKNGPVLLIRAEEARVLFGFWRGQRLRAIEPRLKPGGKYEMATVVLREGDTIATKVVCRLVTEAVALNRRLGNPTAITKKRG
jgi:hypothetical protein